MSDTRFDLESGIQNCWGIVDDLDLLFENLCDGDLDKDQIINIVLGMKELYTLKFDKTWLIFEKLVAELYELEKNPLPPLCSHDDPSWCTEECDRKRNAFLAAAGCRESGCPKEQELAQVPKTMVLPKKSRKKTKK